MINFTFKSEEGDIKVSAPSSWEEVSVEHFINPLFLSGNSMGLLSALSGIDREVLMNSRADITGQLTRMVEFMAKDPKGYKKQKRSDTITLMGKKCKVPKDIELERVGQKIMFQDVMSKHKLLYEGIPEAIAIYIIPELHPEGKFDDAMIPEVVEEIKKLRIVDVFPIADFFLTSYARLIKNGKLY